MKEHTREYKFLPEIILKFLKNWNLLLKYCVGIRRLLVLYIEPKFIRYEKEIHSENHKFSLNRVESFSDIK